MSSPARDLPRLKKPRVPTHRFSELGQRWRTGTAAKLRTDGTAATVAELHELRDRIAALLADLSPTHREIISRRYGLGGKVPETLEELAVRFSLSRERIRRLERDALGQLQARRALVAGL